VLAVIAYLAGVLLATGALVALVMAKGPAPRWRWGKKSDDDPAEDF